MTAKEADPSSIEALARWIASVSLAEIPKGAIDNAKLLLLDSIGCAIAGHDEEIAKATLAMVEQIGGKPQCSIFGCREKTSALNAILANGCLIRALDLNDYVGGIIGGLPQIGGHPSDNIPVALAAGELQNSRGAEILAAIVLGYEVFGRLKEWMSTDTPWDEVSVSGIVAPAMAGWLMRLNEEELSHALALGAARAATPGIVRRGHISAAKSIANALVAQSGLQSALLARLGATGPLKALDSSRGLRSLFRDDGDPGLGAPMPKQPYIMRSSVKTYPCLATGQGAVAAALELHKTMGNAVRQIERIDVVMADYPMIRRQQADPDRITPKSREAADHSFNFLVAVTLLDGKFGLEQYENDRWLDPAVVDLMARLTMKADPEWARLAPGSYPCRLVARDPSGREWTAAVDYPPGFSHGELDADAVIEKFRAITASQISSKAVDAIIDSALSFDQATDPSTLMAATRTAAT